MAKKFLSFIIVPHCAQKFRTVTLSQKSLKALGTLLGVGFLVLIAFMIDYFTMNVSRVKYRGLLKENAEQKKVITDYESSIVKLRDAVKNFESYAKKLNVMAGLRSPEVIQEPGVGDGDTSQLKTPVEDVAPPQQVTGQSVSLKDAQALTQKAEDVGKSLDILAKYFETQTAQLASTPTIWPTIGWVSSGFAFRDDPFTGKRAFHYGFDIATNFGNPVVATADGIVLSLGNDKLSGRNIVIGHGAGITTHYLHLSKFLVQAGEKVKRGDVIGLVGKSGKALGPHLHYEVRVNDKPMNPSSYILEE